MEVSKQIKKYRNENGLSQDELAKRVFVSRQTISSWENDKSYPDVKSLLILSNIFEVTLDVLVKGDVEDMKKIIEQSDIKRFKKEARISTIFLVFIILLAGPLIYNLGFIGLVIYLLIGAVGIYYNVKVEKLKTEYKIRTYKEIVAFTEGRGLTEREINEESGKLKYQMAAQGITILIIAFIVATVVYELSNF